MQEDSLLLIWIIMKNQTSQFIIINGILPLSHSRSSRLYHSFRICIYLNFIKCTNALKFCTYLPFCSWNFFFYSNICLTLILVVIHVYPIKKNHNQIKNIDICEVFNGVLTSIYPFMIISIGKSMIELRKKNYRHFGIEK